jgi:imidazoleglycerol phosphate synthase cyclase subunit
MLTSRVIPCLDVRDGRVVKGVKFQGLRDVGDPAELARRYEEQGADEIVLLDVAATNATRDTAVATVRAVRARLGIPLTVGGGVRTADDAGRLLEAGADKISVNSAAVADPQLVARIADRFGRQCCVVAVDARRTAVAGGGQTAPDGQRPPARWEVLTHAGQRVTRDDAVAWAREVEALGAGEVLLTSWDRDGSGIGYDLELLRAITGAVAIPVIASGGGRTPDHLADALGAGAHAVLIASVLHDGHTTVTELKQQLAARGAEVRP